MERLPKSIQAQVICYPQTGPGGYDSLLAHVRELAAQLPAFYVLGSSFGGPLAIQLAAAEPANVKGLILCASFVRAPIRSLPGLRFFVRGPLVWLLRFARRIPLWIRRERRDPLRIAKSETWSRVPARALAARARAALAVDMRALLRVCASPVLAIEFVDDTVVPRRSGDEIRDVRPSAHRITLRGGHLAVHADPAPVAAEVGRFIEEIEAGRLAVGAFKPRPSASQA